MCAFAYWHHITSRKCIKYAAEVIFNLSGKCVDSKLALTGIAAADFHNTVGQIIDHSHIGMIGVFLAGMDTNRIVAICVI